MIESPAPYSPSGMRPSKLPYSSGWSSVCTASRFTEGSYEGPRGTAPLGGREIAVRLHSRLVAVDLRLARLQLHRLARSQFAGGDAVGDSLLLVDLALPNRARERRARHRQNRHRCENFRFHTDTNPAP